MSTQASPVLATTLDGVPREPGDGLRDVYGLDHEHLLLYLDRVGAMGAALPTAVPGCGRVRSQLAAFWFDQTGNVAPNHFLTDDVAAIRRRLAALGASCDLRSLHGRAHLVNRTRGLPVLCDVVGALFGADWDDYHATGGIAGRTLPTGLGHGYSLPEPLYFPKAEDGTPLAEHALSHRMEPGHARQIATHSRALFDAAGAVARENAGLLLSRARFTFGLLDATVVLVGSPLTTETASFRDADGTDMARDSLDAYLRRIHWQGGENVPELPPEVVRATSDGYRALFERLTGQELV